jgi:hypothetical protein
MNGSQIKKAAETLEGLAAQLEEANSHITKLASELGTAKAELGTAKAELAQRKVASAEEQRNRSTLAKRAAATLLQGGLISTPEKADSFAGEILDHNKALVALHKFAEHAAKAPKVASVVEDPQGTAAVESADAVWDRHATAYLPQGA